MKGHILPSSAMVFFSEKLARKCRHFDFCVKMFFYNNSKTVDRIAFKLLWQLLMVMSHVTCEFGANMFNTCKMAALSIFGKIFRPLYLGNYWYYNVEIFLGIPLWHEVPLVKILWSWHSAFTWRNFARSFPHHFDYWSGWSEMSPRSQNTSFHVNRSIGCGDMACFMLPLTMPGRCKAQHFKLRG